MFEVLLQADRALASGALDKAEQAYWQLIELDPSNAIAAAGLARVALERGDRRLARTFADKALAIDPDSVAARQIVATLEGGRAPAPAGDAGVVLQAAQRLEAVGRKRAAAEEDAEPARQVGAPGRAEAGKAVGGAAHDAAGGEPAANAAALPQVPGGEPLKARRQAGRDAAPAAAAAAQSTVYPARAPKRGALGDRARRHLMEPPKIPPRRNDAFSQAESAAAIEAVDATDERATLEEPAERPPVEKPAGRSEQTAVDQHAAAARIEWAAAMAAAAAEAAATAETEKALDALGATGEEESVALRRALIEEMAAREAGPEAARAGAASIGETPPAGIEALTPEVEAQLAAAEMESEALAAAEETSSRIAEADFEADVLAAVGQAPGQARIEKKSPPTAEEATEEDAEAAALREALDMVLGGESDAPGRPAPAVGPASPAKPAAEPEPGTSTGNDAPLGPGIAADAAEQQRKGLFRRLRGD
jgi:hypothetical protein